MTDRLSNPRSARVRLFGIKTLFHLFKNLFLAQCAIPDTNFVNQTTEVTIGLVCIRYQDRSSITESWETVLRPQMFLLFGHLSKIDVLHPLSGQQHVATHSIQMFLRW